MGTTFPVVGLVISLLFFSPFLRVSPLTPSVANVADLACSCPPGPGLVRPHVVDYSHFPPSGRFGDTWVERAAVVKLFTQS